MWGYTKSRRVGDSPRKDLIDYVRVNNNNQKWDSDLILYLQLM